MRTRNDNELALFFVMVVLTVVVVGVAVTFSDRQFAESRERQVRERALELAVQAAEEGQVLVARDAALVASPDPLAAGWDALPGVAVPVTPQAVTMPILETPSLETVRVKAATDGREIVWWLEWDDPSRDDRVDTGRFTDAVALQFPLAPETSYMMGQAEKMVQILHWKALWQRDVDEHFQDVQDLHPNYWADLYWFATPVEGAATAAARYRVPDSFEDEKSHQWFPAYRAGNPLANFRRRQPVEELVAEGYGTLTPQKGATRARGAWSDGRWAVVFVRPLATDDPLDFRFVPGGIGQFSVAVWEGGAGNVGGRKHWSDWFEFKVQPGRREVS